MYDICDEGVWNNFIILFSIYLDDDDDDDDDDDVSCAVNQNKQNNV